MEKNETLKIIEDCLFNATIHIDAECPDCKKKFNVSVDQYETLKKFMKMQSLLIVWARRFGKIAAATMLRMNERKEFDSDARELYNLAAKALDKMSLESQIEDTIDDGDVSMKDLLGDGHGPFTGKD